MCCRRRTRLFKTLFYHFRERRLRRAFGIRFYPRRQRHRKNMTSSTFKIQAPCQVCGKSVLVDPYGNGFCENCGWVQNREFDRYPDEVRYPNIVSFNKAKLFFSEGKPLSPSFEDFIEGLKFYKEMQFDYEGKTYGVLIGENDSVHFYLFHSLENYQIYPSVSAFYEKAHINDTPLSSLWSDALNADYMNE